MSTVFGQVFFPAKATAPGTMWRPPVLRSWRVTDRANAHGAGSMVGEKDCATDRVVSYPRKFCQKKQQWKPCFE